MEEDLEARRVVDTANTRPFLGLVSAKIAWAAEDDMELAIVDI